MANTYVLVNPHIEGKLETKVKAQNSQEAANMLYKNLSENFNNSIPAFHFTIQKGSSGEGSLYHFKVKETRKNNEVKFSVKSINIKGISEAEEKFKLRLEQAKNKLAQEGGKKHKSKKAKKHDSSDSDSDLDSSSDDYKRAKSYVPLNQPIYYWWYDPYVYRLDSVYVPTFYTYTVPQRIEYAILLP
jgi:hypothetical protein